MNKKPSFSETIAKINIDLLLVNLGNMTRLAEEQMEPPQARREE